MINAVVSGAPLPKFDNRGDLWIPVEAVGVPEHVQKLGWEFKVDGGLAVTYINLTHYISMKQHIGVTQRGPDF